MLIRHVNVTTLTSHWNGKNVSEAGALIAVKGHLNS